MKIHYLQHVPFENPGSILTWAEKNQYPVSSTRLYMGESFPQQDQFDWLVIMGGFMNIYEEDQYPWLVAEKLFIRSAIDEGKVIIGLCLGGQLIADVIGGKVTRNSFKEIGWFPVRFSEKARSLSIFSFFPETPVVFEWHGDTFSALPDTAVCLAENSACKNQAFMYKNRVFGFQFHLENTLPIVQALIENCSDEMIPDVYVQSPEEILSHQEYIVQNNGWMGEFLSRLAKMYEGDEL